MNTSSFEIHESGYLIPRYSFFLILVGFTVAKLRFYLKIEIEKPNWVNFSHFETLNSIDRRLRVTNCFVTERDIGESISHGITILTIHFWTANLAQCFEEEKIDRPRQVNRKVKDSNQKGLLIQAYVLTSVA